jgi:hypothetical protein
MREDVLRKFFEGTCTAEELANDVENAIEQTGPKNFVVPIEDMEKEFTVTADMAVELCDAVLENRLPPGALEAIGFALMASDRFTWDGDSDEVLASVIADWAAPGINYPLSRENVRNFRAWLTRVMPYPAKPPLRKGTFDNIGSITEKRWIDR